VKKPRPPEDPDSEKAAHLLALRWLSARELSEAQVRERLLGGGYAAAAVSSAVQRLVRERVLDDRRCALAAARTEVAIRRRGPHRVLLRLIAIGIERDLAKEVVREFFEETDEQELLAQTLDRRLRGNSAKLKDAAERRKLLGYLVRQGFSPSDASSLIRKRSREK
jgi:SOS response regulatory protein OraA/RecX